jgi:hypothetical protein
MARITMVNGVAVGVVSSGAVEKATGIEVEEVIS